MEQIFNWNCAEPYTPRGQRVKWRGLEVVKGSVTDALKKTYPAGAIGAKTKQSEPDLTKVEFPVKDLLKPDDKTITLAFTFMIPQDTINTPTQGGGHKFHVMKMAALNSVGSQTFQKAKNDFSAICMLGDPVQNPETGKLELRVIAYPYIQGWEYKTNAGKSYPVKQYGGRVKGDTITTIYYSLIFGTPGQSDGSVLIHVQEEDGEILETFRRDGVQFCDAGFDLRLENFEFVTFYGGGDLRYPPTEDVFAYFIRYTLYRGIPSGKPVTPDEPDPETPDPEQPNPEPDEMEADLLRKEITELQSQNQVLRVLNTEANGTIISLREKVAILETDKEKTRTGIKSAVSTLLAIINEM